MKRFVLMCMFALTLALGPAVAAPAVIGTVTANGALRVNGDTVIANGTLTEGAVLEIGSGNSAVRMVGGARLLFSPDSRGKLFRDRFILDKGETRLENGVQFHLEALGLTIRPDDGISAGWIALVGSDRVRVAALTGSFRVQNARGGLVAIVAAGSTLAFEPLAPTRAAMSRLTGVLEERNGHFQLTDQVTHVTADITGQALSVHAGQLVQVTGILNARATPAAGASQVIGAAEVQTIASSAAVAGGGTGGGVDVVGTGAASRGAIGGTKFAVVSGVAAEAMSDGLAASGVPPGPSPSGPLTVRSRQREAPPGQPPGRPPGQPPEQPPGRPPGRPPGPPPLSR